MAPPPLIVLVRHGRTAANAARLLLGHADPPLDDTGVAQAREVAAVLAPLEVSRVLTSPLSRTRQTAAIIAGETRPVEVDDRWIELDYGDLDQSPMADVSADIWARWRTDIDFRPPGGETLAELGRRVRGACDELAASLAPGDTAVVVSHVSPIKAAAAWALGVGDEVTWRLLIEPASISRVAVGERGPQLRTWNELVYRH
jgi:broad specificity phosphatase PhoE